jgi:hypothetical protein
MAIKKLNQILAVEKTVKSKREDEFTRLYQDVQKTELVTGLSRTYQAKDDEGEKLPPESKKVQVKVEDAISKAVSLLQEIFNITAAKDSTNTKAVADIVVEGEVVRQGVPVTHLLWMEKKLLSIAEFINKLPVLPQDAVWSYDAGQGLYRSEPTQTVKTKKREEWKIIVPPTKEHPAQTQKMVEDVPVGTWTTTQLSGAIPESRKRQLQERCEKYLRAVKEARETANQTEVLPLSTGFIVERIFAP